MIDFNDVPKVALEFMNRDHEKATEIVNRLMVEVEQSSPDNKAINSELEQLLQHTQEHFAREEEQMQRCSFPPYPVHKAEHERVLAEMRDVITAWQESNDLGSLKPYLFASLPVWFVEHIATMDTVTAWFIAGAGGPQE